MVFSSLAFLYVFLPLVLSLYFISGKRLKNIILLVSGLLFYAWGEPIYVVIMILSTVIDYTAGRIMHKYDDKPKIRTLVLLVSVCMNLGLLSVFKYSSFLIGNVNDIFGTTFNDPNLPLPIGISFYTFQSMSYTIDLYMRNIKVQKNIVNFTTYVTLFPQIVAGPIVRYADVEKEIDSRTVSMDKVGYGAGIFLKGLAKKVLLANSIGMLWTEVKAMDYGEISVFTAWLGILAFAFQIYFDFSGYSDMAVGLGKVLGFNFPENFDYPYMSKSVSEFWRRWHITLGTWFRLYVYYPLGGNRKGLPRTIINLLIVWGLTGLWHGASWNFVLWGLYFGILIIAEKLFLGNVLKKVPPAISTLYTFLAVLFGWVLFETNTLTDAVRYTKAMFGGTGVGIDSISLYQLSSYFIVMIICIFASTDLFKTFILGVKENKITLKAFNISLPVIQVVIMILCTAYLVDSTYNPFLYFRF
ncbi:MAG TPA: MBOAT family protein [Clostridiales bacterium]|nr:MBOAT family protein [Clostridiales bacterium]